MGPTAALINKVDELQDLLIQQRQISDVSKISEKDSVVRSLNIELAKKTEQVEHLKTRLQQMMAAKPQLGEPNKDLVSYLSSIVQTKQDLVQN